MTEQQLNRVLLEMMQRAQMAYEKSTQANIGNATHIEVVAEARME